MSGGLERRRVLQRLARDGAVLAPLRTGTGHGVFPRGDRRRRPSAVLAPDDLRLLVLDGAIVPSGVAGVWLLSGRGREALAGQVRGLTSRRAAPADDAAGVIARLAAVAGPSGPAFFGGREIVAARRLWDDVQAMHPGAARRAVAAARLRVRTALASLPAPLERCLRAFLSGENGLAGLERRSHWPRRSAALALKFALELLADHYEAAPAA